MNPDWRARHELLVRSARTAGRHALTYYPDAHAAQFADQVIWKGDNSPVTVADREAEAMLRRDLLTAYPEDGFLGEEYGETPSRNGFRWVADPIDGTRSFVRGIPHWATLASLEYQGEPIAGVAYEPLLNRTWHALRGEGAFRDDVRIRVSTVERLENAVMFYSTLNWFVTNDRKDGFVELARRTQRQRGYGDYYGHLLVAQGAGEFMIENNVHEWDVSALKIIVEEAGGRFSNWADEATTTSSDCISSNGRIHALVLATLRGRP